MNKVLLGILFCCISLDALSKSEVTEKPLSGPCVDFSHGKLKVSENNRFLQHEDGTPFFYLGDTAWELFHRLNREDAETYLENRRQKGVNVVQAVALAEFDGLNEPNPYGEKPLLDNDPAKPNGKYFEHVDYIVNKAVEKGIYIGLLPTWGDKVNKNWGVGPVVFNKDNAEQYGKYLGKCYKDHQTIIWILGGDRVPENTEDIWRAMAKGILSEDTNHLITYHPQGGRSCSEWFHDDEWLDFNMLQSGHHTFNNPNYQMIQKDYNKTPVKPCMDAEPCYEDHPVNWKPENGWFDDYDVRKACYWALFAGAHGHTYGCHDIWQFLTPQHPPVSSGRTQWQKAMDFPGAWDMMHAKHLILSRPYFSRIPDQSLIAGDPGEGTGHIQAARGDGYAFIYIASGKNSKINMGKISGENVKAWWYNPRTGEATEIGMKENKDIIDFDPPGEQGSGNDWVLVLDDASKNFTTPGKL